MYMFTQLKTLTLGASLTLTITTSSTGEMSVLALLYKTTEEKGDSEPHETRDILDKPLVLSGTPEELEQSFVDSLMEANTLKRQFRSSLHELQKEADEALKKKRQAQKTSNTTKPVATSKNTDASDSSDEPKKEEKANKVEADSGPDLFSQSPVPEPPTVSVTSTPPQSDEEEAMAA